MASNTIPQCTTCGNGLSPLGICWNCQTNFPPIQNVQLIPSNTFHLFPEPPRISDEDVDRIAEAVVEKIYKSLKL